MKQNKDSESDWQDLDVCRLKMNELDERILALLTERQETAKKIGDIKQASGLEIIDTAREQEVLRSLESKASDHLSPRAIRAIYSEIISASRAVQEPLSAAYLGPEATFSHQAALAFFGNSTQLTPTETIEEVFSLVEKGSVRMGIVPIENSFEGSVNITMDLFYKYDLKIGAETLLRIRNHLITKAQSMTMIKKIFSHPMPIAQCRSWIRNHLPAASLMEVSSTSMAAKMAAEDLETAAIGSRLTAVTYGLDIMEEGIEDQPYNVTRFFVIGTKDATPTGNDKTSILFFLPHVPGSLHKALETLARHNVNMTRIQSRPMRMRNWEYLFFVDIEGHEDDQNVKETLLEMEKRCSFMKRLGSYPSGGTPWD